MSGAPGGRDWASHPPFLYPPYRATVLRAPAKPLVPLKQNSSTRGLPVYGHAGLGPDDHDLTRNARRSGEPLGERIIVAGRVLDERGRPVQGVLIEIWQANAAGRFAHKADQHAAPLDPNFSGRGRCVSDAEGRYRFLTVRPGAFPWDNHANAWRPGHIHFSLVGPSIRSRLVTQMYFPGDPLLAHDPIFQGTPEKARDRLIARFSLAATEAGFALGYDFDIVLRGDAETPSRGADMKRSQTPSHTVGPFFAFALAPGQYGYPFKQPFSGRIEGQGKKITVTGQVFDGKGVAITDALVELWQEEGIARQGTGTTPDGSFRFETVKPAKPYVDVIVFMRGLLSHVHTRLYFDDEARANMADEAFISVPEERRETLLARHQGGGRYRFDIRMQGGHETVFFDS